MECTALGSSVGQLHVGLRDSAREVVAEQSAAIDEVAARAGTLAYAAALVADVARAGAGSWWPARRSDVGSGPTCTMASPPASPAPPSSWSPWPAGSTASSRRRSRDVSSTCGTGCAARSPSCGTRARAASPGAGPTRLGWGVAAARRRDTTTRRAPPTSRTWARHMRRSRWRRTRSQARRSAMPCDTVSPAGSGCARGLATASWWWPSRTTALDCPLDRGREWGWSV